MHVHRQETKLVALGRVDRYLRATRRWVDDMHGSASRAVNMSLAMVSDLHRSLMHIMAAGVVVAAKSYEGIDEMTDASSLEHVARAFSISRACLIAIEVNFVTTLYTKDVLHVTFDDVEAMRRKLNTSESNDARSNGGAPANDSTIEPRSEIRRAHYTDFIHLTLLKVVECMCRPLFVKKQSLSIASWNRGVPRTTCALTSASPPRLP